MSRHPAMVSLSIAVAMCLCSLAHATDNTGTLQTNPFSNPYIDEMETAKDTARKAPPATVHELRGTMMAGTSSQANIGGIIVTLGEDIDGYKLLSVQQHYVILDKNGAQKTLSLDPDDRNSGYE